VAASRARFRVAKTTNMDGTANYHVLDDANGSRPVAEFATEEEAEVGRRELEEGTREVQAKVPPVKSAPKNDADQ
jgi:hypothetical protein